MFWPFDRKSTFNLSNYTGTLNHLVYGLFRSVLSDKSRPLIFNLHDCWLQMRMFSQHINEWNDLKYIIVIFNISSIMRLQIIKTSSKGWVVKQISKQKKFSEVCVWVCVCVHILGRSLTHIDCMLTIIHTHLFMSRSNNVLMGAEEVLPPDHVKWTAHIKDQQAPAAASVDLLSSTQ